MAIRKVKNLRRLFWSLGGVAASLAVVLVGVLIAQLLIKQVPVYQGMSISSMEFGPSLLAGEGRTVLPISYLGDHGPGAGGYRDHNQSIDQSKPFGEGASASVEEEAANSLKVEGAAEKVYYAKPNEEIYITIHISNPDSYEILSFTLNGKKYSSYMFEDGSDMENLILKVNVGEVEGIVEYTIDAIKYVDGTQIKDVRMEGDQTVRAGVATDRQPVAQIGGETVGLYEFRLNVTVSDPLSLIERSLGEVWAVLYDGEQLVGMQQLEIGKTESVIFEGLSDGTVYQYAVVAYYDALDGTGIHYYALAKKAFCTRTVLALDSITVAQESVSFAYTWDQAVNQKAVTSVQLYQNGALVREIDRDATAVEGLLSNTEYTLVVHFKNKGADDTVELVFRTAAKATPVVAIVDPTKTQTSVGFGINVTDPDHVGAITKIELLHGEDTPVVAENTDVRAFNGLLSNNTYTVRVTYIYDLNDGKGAQTSVKTLEIKTEAKATPVVTIVDPTKTQTSVGFGINVTDPDHVGAITKIELLHENDAPIVAEHVDVRAFSNLLSNNLYTLRVTYEYDLNDGKAKQMLTVTKDMRTEAKTVPELSVTEPSRTQTSIGFEIDITDPDQIANIITIELWQGDRMVAVAASLDTRLFEGLESYVKYTVKVNYQYDLNDGMGIREGVAQHALYTLPYFTTLQTACTNTSGIMLGESLFLKITVDNPSGLMPKAVTINGVKYAVNGLSTATNVYVEMQVNESVGVGLTELTVDAIIFEGAEEDYTHSPNANHTVECFINGELDITDFLVVDANGNEVEFVYPSTEAYFLILFDNSTGYTVTSIKINDTVYSQSDFALATPDTVKIRITLTENTTYGLSVTSVAYSNQYIGERVKLFENVYNEVTIFRSDEIIEIRTPEDLMNMSDPNHYVLMNDLDLSGYNVENFGTFQGYFEGNGYTVSGYSVIKTFYDHNVHLGLFSNASGVIKNLNIRDVTVMATLQTTASGKYYQLYYGGICATLGGELRLENVTHSGEISLTNQTGYYPYDLAVGGLIGICHHIIVDATTVELINCSNQGKLTAKSNVGGLVGWNNDYLILTDCQSDTQIVTSKPYSDFVGTAEGTVVCRSKEND